MKWTDEQMASAKRHGDVTKNGVAFDWWLVNVNGACFMLMREDHHSDEDIALAKEHIRRDRDVVGRINVATKGE
jgi:hypothetical protein